MNETFNRILKRVPLEVRLRNHLQMHDKNAWDDGEYFGKADASLQDILEEVEQWQKDGALIRYEDDND